VKVLNVKFTRKEIKEFERVKKMYLAIKLMYEEACKRAREENRKWDELAEQGKITDEEWAEKTVDVDEKHGVLDLLTRLNEAEDCLIKVGSRLFERCLSEEQRKELKKVWDCKYATIREKVVDLLLRWFPEEEFPVE